MRASVFFIFATVFSFFPCNHKLIEQYLILNRSAFIVYPFLCSRSWLQNGKILPPQKRCPDIILNCIRWWGSCSGALERVKYWFIVISPRSTQNRNGSTSLDPVYASNKVKLATLVEGDPNAPFSIATTLRCKGEYYSIPRNAPKLVAQQELRTYSAPLF